MKKKLIKKLTSVLSMALVFTMLLGVGSVFAEEIGEETIDSLLQLYSINLEENETKVTADDFQILICNLLNKEEITNKYLDVNDGMVTLTSTELLELDLLNSQRNKVEYLSSKANQDMSVSYDNGLMSIITIETIKNTRDRTYKKRTTDERRFNTQGIGSLFVLEATFREAKEPGIGMCYEVLDFWAGEEELIWLNHPLQLIGYETISLDADTMSTVGVAVIWTYKVNGAWFNSTLQLRS